MKLYYMIIYKKIWDKCLSHIKLIKNTPCQKMCPFIVCLCQNSVWQFWERGHSGLFWKFVQFFCIKLSTIANCAGEIIYLPTAGGRLKQKKLFKNWMFKKNYNFKDLIIFLCCLSEDCWIKIGYLFCLSRWFDRNK